MCCICIKYFTCIGAAVALPHFCGSMNSNKDALFVFLASCVAAVVFCCFLLFVLLTRCLAAVAAYPYTAAALAAALLLHYMEDVDCGLSSSVTQVHIPHAVHFTTGLLVACTLEYECFRIFI